MRPTTHSRAGAAVVTNNARNSYTVIEPPGDIDGDGDVDAADFARCVACMAGPEGGIPGGCSTEEFAACDLHEDSGIDLLDIADFVPPISAP